MKYLKTVLIIFLLPQLAACFSDSNGNPTVDFDVLLTGDRTVSGMADDRRILYIDSQHLLDETMAYYDTDPAPEIDFSVDQVILLAMGLKPSQAYTLLVDRIIERDNGLILQIIERAPGEGCVIGGAIGYR